MCSTQTTPWKIEKHLCRCCHAEGTFTNMGIPCYDRFGQAEVYADILRDCFNVYISPVSGELNQVTYTICAECIQQLLSASKFKKQVLLCEKKFAEMYTKNVISVSDGLAAETKVKIEFEGVKSEFKLDFSDEEDTEVLAVRAPSDNDTFRASDNSDDDDTKSLSLLKDNPNRTSNRIKTSPKALNVDATPGNEPKKKATKRKPYKKSVKEKAVDSVDAGPAPKRKKVNSKKTGLPEQRQNRIEIIQPYLYVDRPKEKERPKPRNFVKIKNDEYQLVNGGYKCTRCQKDYKTYKAVLQHIKIVHYKKWKTFTLVVCTQCPEKFKTSILLNEHQLKVHGEIKMIKCSACTAEFHNSRNLKKHMDSFHMLGTPKNCEHCDYVCFSASKLKRHIQKHIIVKSHVCKFCGKAFVRRANWILHERIHTREKLKQCSYCDQSFVQRTSLKYHILKYHPGKPA